MKKQNKVMALIEKGAKFADEHQREIMLGGAIAGTVITAVLSWKAGIKADKILAEQKEKMDTIVIDMGKDEPKEISEEEEKQRRKEITIETIKKMAPVVAPPILAGASTIIAVVAGYKSASTQIATLSALYSMSEKALSDQLEKTKEIVGPKKAQEIKDSVAADKVKNNPIENSDKVFRTGNGETPCYDPKTDRYFYSSPESIKAAANRINLRMMEEYYISLNEFYDELGLPDTELGEMVGFNVEDGLIDIDNLFSATIGKNDTPTLVLEYEISPKFSEHRGKMFR